MCDLSREDLTTFFPTISSDDALVSKNPALFPSISTVDMLPKPPGVMFWFKGKLAVHEATGNFTVIYDNSYMGVTDEGNSTHFIAI